MAVEDDQHADQAEDDEKAQHEEQVYLEDETLLYYLLK